MRSVQASRNALSSLVSQIVSTILAFVTRTAFIYTLTTSYLGLSGLFQSVLTVLNLSELGIGTAVIYALYKPIAENDIKKIQALMKFYRKAYWIIGWIVLIVGSMILPFLHLLVKGADNLVNIRIVFFLYIIESVSSYWFFAYKRSLLEAHQRKYVAVNYTTLTNIFGYTLRICSLLILRANPKLSYYFYLSIGIFSNIVSNALISKKVDSDYAYIKDRNCAGLSIEEKKPIQKNVAGVFISKFSGIMINSIDNILISAFINISLVGIYSNYLTLKAYLIMPISIVFGSITAGIGDFCATETVERKEKLFNSIQFAYFWIYGFACIGYWVLCNLFISSVWLNEKYLLSEAEVMVISVNFLLDGLAGAVISFRDAHGLYWKTKFRYLFSAILNAILSLILIKPLGVLGVLIGTTASILLLVLFDPIIVFKNVFNKSAGRYYKQYIKYICIIVVTAILVKFIVNPLEKYNISGFILSFIVCLIVPNVLWYIIFRKDENFVYLKNTVIRVISGTRSKIFMQKKKHPI